MALKTLYRCCTRTLLFLGFLVLCLSKCHFWVASCTYYHTKHHPTHVFWHGLWPSLPFPWSYSFLYGTLQVNTWKLSVVPMLHIDGEVLPFFVFSSTVWFLGRYEQDCLSEFVIVDRRKTLTKIYENSRGIWSARWRMILFILVIFRSKSNY